MIRPFDLTIRDRKLSMLLDIEPGRHYSDFALGHYLDRSQAPEPELIHVLFRALKPGDLAVDAGACVGFFTIIMSKLVGPSGKVIAIEPDSRNLAVLRKNIDINDCNNVQIIDRPIGSDKAHTTFYESEENGQSSLHGAEQPFVKAANATIATLADILRQNARDCPVLLKMDIEGSETDALHGIGDANCDIPYIVSEVNPEALQRADSSPEELVELMRRWGYTSYQIHTDGALPSCITPMQKLRITRPNTNMLFTRQPDLVKMWPEVEL